MTGPSELEIVALGAFAGFTIFLGLLIGLRRDLSVGLRAFLSALAAGILLFLFYDVLKNADELINPLIPASGGPGTNGLLALEYVVVLLVGWTAGFLSLAAFEWQYTHRLKLEGSSTLARPGLSTSGFTLDPLAVSTMIAVGIGLHNFSEGLAIGTAYAGGAIAAGTVLVIGFAAHNATEGFGILGPGLASNQAYSGLRLFVLGLVGGGPTFLGTLIGSAYYSGALSILFFGLAAGAIIYVVMQMMRPIMAPGTRAFAWYGIVLGFILGFATDVIVSFGGA